jgi:hypothetical protein
LVPELAAFLEFMDVYLLDAGGVGPMDARRALWMRGFGEQPLD